MIVDEPLLGHREPFGKLTEPFPATDIDWRVGQAGKNTKGVWAKVLAYITNRAIMDRLDTVCGPENWKNEFRYEPGGAILCGLSLRIVNEWVTKWDGAEATDIEAVKGGLSNAMKRAGVQWGIGRYLYDLEEGWAVVSENGIHYAGAAKNKDGSEKHPAFRWSPPQLPKWALPEGAPVADVVDPEKRANLTEKNKDKLYAKAGGNAALVHGVVTAVTKKPCTREAWPAITAAEYEGIVDGITEAMASA